MKMLPLIAASALAASPVLAEDTRQLDAHEHGVGQLDIAIDGQKVAMELHAPGADIVGFEYEAKSAEDLATIETALAMLARPLELFSVPAAAGCSVVQASAELESEDAHDAHDEDGDHKDDDHDHDHDKHDDDDHDAHAEEGHDDHDEHKEDGHDDDDHDAHAEEGHDDHDEHKEDGHDDHDAHAEDDHEDHADEAGHTEFHAEYMLNCAEPTAITEMTFAYFATFPNALEVEVQIISDSGATSFEVERADPTLDLSGLF